MPHAREVASVWGRSPRRVVGVSLALLTGCGGAEGTASFARVDSAGVEIATTGAEGAPARWSLAEPPSVEIGTASAGGPTEFFGVSDARFLADGGFVVANQGSEELRVFDASGAFVRSMGGSGGGPGEFRGLSFVRSLGDSLLAFDPGNGRVQILGPDGAHVRSYRLEGRTGLLVPVALQGADLLAFAGTPMSALPRDGVNVDTVLVSRHGPEGALVDSVGRFPHNARFVQRDGEMQTTIAAPFVAWASFEVWEGRLCHAFGPAVEIRCHGPGGRLERVLRVDVAPRPVTDEDVQSFWTRQIAAVEPTRRAALRRVRAALPFPDAFPAFSALLVDDAGRLWARRYAAPDEGEWRWWVFSPEGRLEAELRVPLRTRIFDVRGSRVLTLRRDDFDVERMGVYRLETGAGADH